MANERIDPEVQAALQRFREGIADRWDMMTIVGTQGWEPIVQDAAETLADAMVKKDQHDKEENPTS